jgi:2'-5' RNA ligase
MSLLRAFIAVELPRDIRQAVCDTTAVLRTQVGTLVRWVPLENMHLTLKFLGDVSPPNVDLLSQMLRAETDHFNCFDLR